MPRPRPCRPPPRLRHLHLAGRIPYTTPLALQSHILNQHFAHRTQLRTAPASPSPFNTTHVSLDPEVIPAIPLPALLTFNTTPTYTVGRRHLATNPLSPSQISFLTPTNHRTGKSLASFHASSRGGLLTYHGPGQLTAFALIDLREHGLGARQYVHMLEDAVINTCKKLGVPNVGVSCTDPGVWMLDEGTGEVQDRKICALGVQISRGVSSYGVGLNVVDAQIAKKNLEQYLNPEVETDVGGHIQSHKSGRTGDGEGAGGGKQEGVSKNQGFRGYLGWGFNRIVACGLEGKETTWLYREYPGWKEKGTKKPTGWSVGQTATVFAQELSNSLTKSGKLEMGAVQRIPEQILQSDDDLRAVMDSSSPEPKDKGTNAQSLPSASEPAAQTDDSPASISEEPPPIRKHTMSSPAKNKTPAPPSTTKQPPRKLVFRKQYTHDTDGTVLPPGTGRPLVLFNGQKPVFRKQYVHDGFEKRDADEPPRIRFIDEARVRRMWQRKQSPENTPRDTEKSLRQRSGKEMVEDTPTTTSIRFRPYESVTIRKHQLPSVDSSIRKFNAVPKIRSVVAESHTQ